MFRKISIFICCVMMFITLGVDAFAASSPVVYADKVTLGGSEDVRVPVCISRNPGIMGFHFVVKYDPDIITITNVTASEAISSGVFNQNLNLKNGKFDVVWSNAENIAENGPLFYLFIRADDLEGDTSIKLSYVEDDTFNESFENVALTCKNISISIDAEAGGSGEEQKDYSASIVDGNPENDFVAGEISDEVTSSLNEKDVILIANEVMEEEGLDGISKANPEQARKILYKIKSRMEEKGHSTEVLDELLKKTETNENLDADEIYTEAVRKIYKDSVKMAKNEDQSIEVDSVVKHGSHAKTIVIAMICVASLALAIILFFRRKKIMGGTEN